MNKKSIILIVTLFALLIVGMFIYANLKNAELQATETSVPVEKKLEEITYSDVTRIDAKHYFVDGTHTLVGEINFSTPCDLLESEATIAESNPEHVTIEFFVINNTNNCVQMVTSQRFKVELQASPRATFSALFEGRDVDLNLIPAAEEELPDDFELFLKG
jgi:hypothetical protein